VCAVRVVDEAVRFIVPEVLRNPYVSHECGARRFCRNPREPDPYRVDDFLSDGHRTENREFRLYRIDEEVRRTHARDILRPGLPLLRVVDLQGY
jgi:hypothetical protein